MVNIDGEAIDAKVQSNVVAQYQCATDGIICIYWKVELRPWNMPKVKIKEEKEVSLQNMMRPCQIGWKFQYPEIIKRSIIWGDSFFIAFRADNVQGEMCLA